MRGEGGMMSIVEGWGRSWRRRFRSTVICRVKVVGFDSFNLA